MKIKLIKPKTISEKDLRNFNYIYNYICGVHDHCVFPKTNSEYIWLIYNGRRVVGFGILNVTETTGTLERAGILKSHRGKGLHHRLIRCRVNYGRRLKLKRCKTYVVPGNLISLHNLIAEGFRVKDDSSIYRLEKTLT
jgi:GNAT superfamily N-acetyltransferase